jgi:hypothetical protein
MRLLPEDQYRFIHYKQLVYNDTDLFKKLTSDWHFPFIILRLPGYIKKSYCTGLRISINMFAIDHLLKKQKQLKTTSSTCLIR